MIITIIWRQIIQDKIGWKSKYSSTNNMEIIRMSEKLFTLYILKMLLILYIYIYPSKVLSNTDNILRCVLLVLQVYPIPLIDKNRWDLCRSQLYCYQVLASYASDLPVGKRLYKARFWNTLLKATQYNLETCKAINIVHKDEISGYE